MDGPPGPANCRRNPAVTFGPAGRLAAAVAAAAAAAAFVAAAAVAVAAAIAAAVASFDDQGYFEAQNNKVIASREKLVIHLEEMGFKVLPSKANFIFASLPTKDAGELATELREKGIIVRYFNKPRINQYLRITIGTDEQNQRLVNTLKNDILN